MYFRYDEICFVKIISLALPAQKVKRLILYCGLIAHSVSIRQNRFLFAVLIPPKPFSKVKLRCQVALEGKMLDKNKIIN